MITYNSKRNREHQCPEIVRNYNLHMGGVDLSDMRCYMFLDERRTIRWNKKVFFTLLIEYYLIALFCISVIQKMFLNLTGDSLW